MVFDRKVKIFSTPRRDRISLLDEAFVSVSSYTANQSMDAQGKEVPQTSLVETSVSKVRELTKKIAGK
ncbi:hypothetical protein ACQ4M3_25065 [Leptolyngbya sp. AN03gr2]|uniref:hypothetical protein n=1 Tax=unclassified Leptolyngbya TaxID=2650499 RepID=UPI003D317664